MKKSIMLCGVSFFIGFLVCVLAFIICLYPILLSHNKDIMINKTNTKNDFSGISMMYETEAGSGKYKQSEGTDWLGEGYTFNKELSGCENGGKLTWDNINKTVKLSSVTSDRCYVYFDVYIKPFLEEYIKKEVYGTDPNLFLHDSSLINGANDGNYRYSGDNPNNYVCFGSEETPCPEENLYRIIGIFGNQVKLMKSTKVTSSLMGTNGAYRANTFYYWDRESDYNNTWSNSLLNTVNLNTNFLNNIGSTWASKIATTTWQVGGTNWSTTNTAKQYYDDEIGVNKANITYEAKIGLMYVSDYGFAESRENWTTALYDYDSNNNWMYMGSNE